MAGRKATGSGLLRFKGLRAKVMREWDYVREHYLSHRDPNYYLALREE